MALRLATAPLAAFDAVYAAAANDALDAALDLVDGGSGPGQIKVYTGGPPATVNSAATGTLLATFTLPDPAFAAATGGVKTLDADPDITAVTDAAGTPGWARIQDSAGATIADGTVGTSAADFITASSPWLSGQNVDLTAGTITIPA